MTRLQVKSAMLIEIIESLLSKLEGMQQNETIMIIDDDLEAIKEGLAFIKSVVG